MRRRDSRHPRVARPTIPDTRQDIDALYGLEPVFEPGLVGDPGDAEQGLQVRTIQCPYCGEDFETQIDTSTGSARYVEDCQVCCQPIEFVVEVDVSGDLESLSTLRSD